MLLGDNVDVLDIVVRCRWTLRSLAVIGFHIVEYCWMWLGTVGWCWLIDGVVGRCWVLLDVLDVVV